jgi:hypothetical protein
MSNRRRRKRVAPGLFLETSVSSLRCTRIESRAHDTPFLFSRPSSIRTVSAAHKGSSDEGRTVLPTVNRVRHSDRSPRLNAHVSGARVSALSCVETERAVSASPRFFVRSLQVLGIRCFFCICGKTCAAYQPHVRPLHQSARCYCTGALWTSIPNPASTSAILLSRLVKAD